MLIFTFQNLIILFNTYLLAKYYFNFQSQVDRTLSFLILSYAQIILILTFLGALKLLYLGNIILVEFIILLFLILVTQKRGIDIRRQSIHTGLLARLATLNLNKIEIFCLSTIFGFAIVKIMINLVNPPFGWDDLNYHFTFPVEWLKHGNLVNPIIVNDYLAPTYYPINGSLIFFWLILPLRSVFLADLGQLPFFIISFLSIFAIARKLGISKHYSLFAAVLFTITPNYFKQLEIAYVDVMVAALFLSGLNFLMLFYEEPGIKSLFISAICIGGLIGTKIITLPYAAIIFMFFIYIVLSKYKVISKKNVLLFVLLFVFSVVLLGGFSYIRNFFLTGNMFYPISIEFFNRVILKGVMGKCFSRGDGDFSLGKLLFHEGMGIGFIVFVLPGILFAVLKIFNKKKLHPQIIFLFGLIPLLYLIYRFVIGLANTRYLYPWIGVCYLVCFLGLDRFKISIKIINYLVAITIIASIAEIAGHWELAVSTLISLLIFFGFLKLLKLSLKVVHSLFKIVFFIGLCLIVLNLLFMDYTHNEYLRYKSSRRYSGFWPDAIAAWIWVNSNTNNNKIAYVGRPVPLPLYGTFFKNDVFYVSVNKNLPILHNYKNAWYGCFKDYSDFHKDLEKPGNYRGDANFAVWFENLSRLKIDYLFIYSLHQTKVVEFPMEDKWAKLQPQVFIPVFNNNTIHIYKIIR